MCIPVSAISLLPGTFLYLEILLEYWAELVTLKPWNKCMLSITTVYNVAYVFRLIVLLSSFLQFDIVEFFFYFSYI